jgi:hypothetical protein
MPLLSWEVRNEQYLSGRLVWLRSQLESLIRGDGGCTENGNSGAVGGEENGEGPHSPSALEYLAGRLALSHFEGDLLLLCAAMELDPRIGALCAECHRDANKPFPTFALAARLLAEPAWDALSPQRPLRRLRLFEN